MMNHDDFTHDVFLSFRGGTRYSFTDHLYRSLLRHGINVFRDEKNLKIGDEIGPSLLQAIETSRSSIVVLCKDYASSSWCLDELVKIIHCYENNGRSVDVIFYKVEPSDVRHQKNSYKIAMIEHEKRFGRESEKVKAWRFALNRVCDLSGLHYKDYSYESECIETIVRNISAKLPPMPLQTKHLVGLDSRFEQVKSLFDTVSDDSICMLGISGAGGIGKTTFAMDIYNKIRHRFEAASFLANVREKSNESARGLEDLQRTLLSETGVETQTMLGSTFKGCSEIKGKLSNKRVLLVLDDVDSVTQLQSLAGGHDWFGSGSIIIVTTRDTEVLRKHDVKIYKLEELNYHESIELFCWYAFNMNRPVENFAKISSHAISYAKGIPLALRVIGSNLKGKSIEEWDIEIQRYRMVPDAEIHGVLEISYKGLSDLDQKSFLDIACFFKGERWDYVKRILDACNFYPVIRVFVSKCLITVDENGCLEMHDLIQDMGREIVRKESTSNPGERSRLWSHKDVLDVLKGNMGSPTVEGIMLHPPKQEKVDHWAINALEKMKNLRILIVRNTLFSSGPSYLSNSLRLLDWKWYPSKNFPPDFSPRRIVDLKLPHSSMILKNPFQDFEDLTFINLSHSQSITQLPNLSGAKNLRVFTVDKCLKLVSFDTSVGFMPNLVYLSASGCTELKSFVPKMYLPSLQVLSFSFCKKFEHFPEVIKKMDKPLKINMISTAIKEFPKSIGNLTGLEYIDMSFCKGLTDLSNSFLLLPKLLTLKIDGCTQLGESFQKFKERHSVANMYPNIQTLHFSEANLSYEDVNAIIENFPKLEDLKVSHNGFLALPSCIGGSMHLKSLDVSFCTNLTDVPELPLSIQKIYATHCPSLTLEASSVLWSKVSQEIQRIQVVMPMPKREIPEWFDCVCTRDTQDIPLLWGRRKLPVVALALVFGEVKKTENFSELVDAINLLTGVKGWHIVSLHLFIDGQEFCSKNCHYFNVGEDHVLLFDLRVLFSNEEWQKLDASLGNEWKAIQVQYESDLVLTNWGVYAYKQETSMDDIQFITSNHNSFSYKPSTHLVPKGSPKQEMKHVFASFNPRDMFNEYMPQIESEEGPFFSLKVLLQSLRNAKAEVIEKTSASAYGASLKQDHEDSVEDVIQVLEMIKENFSEQFADASPEDLQIAGGIVERILRARVELMKENSLDIGIIIILQYTDTSGAINRRFWGTLEIKLGDPFYKPVLKMIIQLSSWGLGMSDMRETVVELKCQSSGEEEASSSHLNDSLDEGNYNPELQELMRRIEQDAMSFNKSYGKMKASIVKTDEPFSENHLLEALLLRRLMILGTLTMFGSAIKFKITPYGKMRAEDEPFRIVRKCFWDLIFVLHTLIEWSFYFFLGVFLLFYRIPIIRKLLVWGWWLVKQIFLCCKKLYKGVGKIVKRIKEKEL